MNKSLVVLLVSWLALLVVIRSSQINTALPNLLPHQLQLQTQNFTVKNKQYFTQVFRSSTSPPVINIKQDNNSDPSNSSACSFDLERFQLQQISSLRLPLPQKKNPGRYFSDMVVLNLEQMIYTVDNSLTVTVYKYGDAGLDKLASQNIRTSTYDSSADSKALLVATEDNSAVYLFSRYGVYLIQPHLLLTKMQIYKLILTFNTLRTTVFSKAYDGMQAVAHKDRVYLVTETEGLIVFNVMLNLSLAEIKKISTYKGKAFAPVSVELNTDLMLLFMLDKTNNIYIFRQLGDSIKEYDVIEFGFQANLKIQASGRRIFFSFLSGNTVKICELQYDVEQKEAKLIRYYKIFDWIYDFLAESERLYVLSDESFDVFPTFVDPRLILAEHNGGRMLVSAKRFIRFSFQHFVFASQDSIKVYRLITHPNRLICRFPNNHEKVTVEYKANFTECEANTWGRQRKIYNEYCEVTKTFEITVDIPERSEMQIKIMYLLVISVVIIFVIGVLCLMQWRNGRIDLIDKFADEIRAYRQGEQERRQKQSELVQENQVEIPDKLYTDGDNEPQPATNLSSEL